MVHRSYVASGPMAIVNTFSQIVYIKLYSCINMVYFCMHIVNIKTFLHTILEQLYNLINIVVVLFVRFFVSRLAQLPSRDIFESD